ALLDVVARIHRQLANHIAADHGLTTEAGMRRQIPGGVEPVRLVVLHLTQMLLPLANDDMARRAGTAAATRVLQRDAEMLRNIKKRLRLSVMRVRKASMVEFHRLRLAVDDERHFRHAEKLVSGR